MAEVVASDIIPVETPLTDPSQLWDLSRFFMMSWTERFSISTSWFTTEVTANNGGQKRLSVSGKPGRILGFTIMTLRRRETWLLLQGIKRMGQGRSLVPIYGDFTKLTSQSSTGSVTLECNTANRRFFVGARVAIAVPTTTAEITTFEIGIVASITPSSMNVSTGIVNTYPENSRVYPLLECDIMLNGPVSVLTDMKARASFLCKETEGVNSLPPLLEISATSPYSVQMGYPVFYTQLQWASAMSEGYRGSARTTHSGIGDLFELVGSRPRFISGRHTYSLSRSAAWKVISFFDFVCGSAWPFFVLSVLAPFEVKSVLPSQIIVRASGPLEDWNDLLYIGIIKRSTNLAYVSKIFSVSRTGDYDILQLETILPDLSDGDYRSVNPVYLVRFDGDELSETWVTNTQASISFSVVEVLEEASVTLVNVEGT